jgi:hypothetical protein
VDKRGFTVSEEPLAEVLREDLNTIPFRGLSTKNPLWFREDLL